MKNILRRLAVLVCLMLALALPAFAEGEKGEANITPQTTMKELRENPSIKGSGFYTYCNEWIEGDSYAKKHRGQYAMRNSNSAPWENRVDLHIAQDIYVLKARDSKFQVTFDVTNFANMLNKKWGASYSAVYNVMPLQVIGNKKGEDGNYVNTYAYNSRNTIVKNDILSRWHAQIGVKYIF